MKKVLILTLALVVVLFSAVAVQAEDKEVPAVLKYNMKGLKGGEVKLSDFHGKVVVIVNVASQCGLTPQYEGLQGLYKKYKDKGLVIVGVPANEFGRQEPGSNEEIAKFCKENYAVTFPMLTKSVVKGEGKCDLYQFLTSKKTNPKFAGEIKWNFTKFLVNRKGEVVARFEPRVKPEAMVKKIEEELGKK